MGYFRIDNRSVGEPLREADTDWCRHCHKIVSIKGDWRREGGKCAHCGILCGRCARALFEGGICYPFKKRIDDMMKEEARRKAFPI